MKILFVCSGNICRSPMAAEYFRHRAARAGLSHVLVDSSGTLGIEGHPASPEAVRALEEISIDLKAHRSRGVTRSDLATADIVIAMDHGHLESLARKFPERQGQRYLLRAFEAGPDPRKHPRDLADPIGEPIEMYREAREIIVRCLDHLALYLKHRPAGKVDV